MRVTGFLRRQKATPAHPYGHTGVVQLQLLARVIDRHQLPEASLTSVRRLAPEARATPAVGEDLLAGLLSSYGLHNMISATGTTYARPIRPVRSAVFSSGAHSLSGAFRPQRKGAVQLRRGAGESPCHRLFLLLLRHPSTAGMGLQWGRLRDT